MNTSQPSSFFALFPTVLEPIIHLEAMPKDERRSHWNTARSMQGQLTGDEIVFGPFRDTRDIEEMLTASVGHERRVRAEENRHHRRSYSSGSTNRETRHKISAAASNT